MKTLRLALLTCCFAAAFSSTAFAEDVPAIWKAKCESCHGADGKAQTKQGKKEKIEDMTTEKWQTEWTDEKMKKIILEGSKDNTKMKAFKGKISDADVDGLIKHIRTLKAG